MMPDSMTLLARMEKYGYQPLPQNRTLSALELYVAGRAITLYGDPGSGKTYFFKVLGAALGRPVNVLSLAELQRMSFEGAMSQLVCFEDQELLIDDIGREDRSKEYGDLDYLDYILERRCQMRTHFTSNLGPDELLERYGSRTFDRLNGAAVFFDYNNIDPSGRRVSFRGRQEQVFNVDGSPQREASDAYKSALKRFWIKPDPRYREWAEKAMASGVSPLDFPPNILKQTNTNR